MYIDHTRSVNHPDKARWDGRGVLIITSSFGGGRICVLVNIS